VSSVLWWSKSVVPGPGSRWGPRPSAVRQVRRAAVLVAIAPLLAGAAAFDAVKDAWLRRPGTARPGNAYRLVARRR